MSQRRFVVLDRDGTLIAEHHYLSDPVQVELLPGASDALRLLRECGLGLVVITNQSGLGRGYFDHHRLDLIHQRLHALLSLEGISLDGIYVCPHRPDEDCGCRKPRSGLFKTAARELDFDPKASFVIGDKACDVELGQQVGALTFLVHTGYGAQVAAEAAVNPDYVVDDVAAAARIIQRLLVEETS